MKVVGSDLPTNPIGLQQHDGWMPFLKKDRLVKCLSRRAWAQKINPNPENSVLMPVRSRRTRIGEEVVAEPDGRVDVEAVDGEGSGGAVGADHLATVAAVVAPAGEAELTGALLAGGAHLVGQPVRFSGDVLEESALEDLPLA